ncbi:MAG: choice-of-anchor tandem repeat GloVer-containing protein [Candidatus Sulfotelmatobacter sp.]
MNRKKPSLVSLRVISLAIFLLALRLSAAAQTERVIHSFNGLTHVDGSGPEGLLVADSAGNLYGTAFGGGSSNLGIVYELSPPVPPSGTWTETILYNFGGPDGAQPAAGLVADSAGNFYGTTAYGGNGPCTAVAVVIGCGVVFELSPPSVPGGNWTESVLYNFQFGSDSGGSQAPLIFDSAGNLYGTASGEGFDSAFTDSGSVFELSPPSVVGGSWKETTLTSFPAFNIGQNPFAPLTFDSSGNLYGTTYFGGNRNCPATALGCGVVFELSPPSVAGGSWTETVIRTFNGGNSDGANPVGGVVLDTAGTLFGTTSRAGSTSSAGTVFAMRPPSTVGGAWGYRTIHTFGGATDGAGSRAGVTIGPQRALYGTTANGGTTGDGIVFRLTPPTTGGSPWTETILHSFQYSVDQKDGAIPYGGVIIHLGALLGTTLGGGQKNGGSVYFVIP